MDHETILLAYRVAIATVAVTWLVVLWRSNRDPRLKNFNIISLVMNKEGFADRIAIMELFSWIVLTLVLIKLTWASQLTEWFVLIYAGLPTARAGQAAWLKSKPGGDVHQTKEQQDGHDH